MGLDQFFNVRTFVSQYANDALEYDDDGNIISDINPAYSAIKFFAGADRILSKEYYPFANGFVITYTAGYLRKANAIHNWIVQNSGEEDNCQDIILEKETIVKLLDVCRTVREHPYLAPSLLPTKEGFFFGSVSYDDWYFKDLARTIDILEECLKLIEKPNTYIFYNSSW